MRYCGRQQNRRMYGGVTKGKHVGCCNDKNKTGSARIAQGVVGLTKAIVGIDRAPDVVVAARRAICRQCDRATRHRDGVRVLRCLEFKCWIKQATKVAGKDCPLGKWNKDAS
jgi:hypothetical protein